MFVAIGVGGTNIRYRIIDQYATVVYSGKMSTQFIGLIQAIELMIKSCKRCQCFWSELYSSTFPAVMV